MALWNRSRSLLAILMAMTCLAVFAGCGTRSNDPAPPNETPLERAWRHAGVANPTITETFVGGSVHVTVVVRTSLPLPDPNNQEGFARRAAKIMWRNHLGPIDVLEIWSGETTGGQARHDTWHESDLEANFGPRPTGLDVGSAPPPFTPGGGPYRHPRVSRLNEAENIIQAVLARTADEFYRIQAPATRRGDHDCYTGLFGDEPTGSSQAAWELQLTLPGEGEAEADLPALAAYLGDLGLTVDTTHLDNGNSLLRADIEEVGTLTVYTYPGEAPRLVLLTATTTCLAP